LRHSADKKRLWALFITQDGSISKPIIGIVTAMDMHRIIQSWTLLDSWYSWR
jgi:hypothetical protein